MVEILYFAWVRERMGKPSETIPLPAEVTTVAQLATWLRERDAPGRAALADPALVRVAVNQDFAAPDTPVNDGDEVAFFPPVTGG